ncbi:unnamed protein product, partial [Closterium sp. NIES-54]
MSSLLPSIVAPPSALLSLPWFHLPCQHVGSSILPQAMAHTVTCRARACRALNAQSRHQVRHSHSPQLHPSPLFLHHTITGRARSMSGAQCTEYSLEEVLKATSNWSSDNQLGSGAFGDIYKGVCPHDGTTLWAVKRAKLIDVEFHKE